MVRWFIVFFFVLLVPAGDVYSQTSKDQTSKTIDPPASETVLSTIEKIMASDEFDAYRNDPHLYIYFASELLPFENMLEKAEQFILKGIDLNTVENIQKSPYASGMDQNSLIHQQKLESGRLNSLYAWLHYKKGRLDAARERIQEAIIFKKETSKPDAEDIIRLGIIEYETGNKNRGWEYIIEALVTDTEIEHQDPWYESALEKIIREKFGAGENVQFKINELRTQYMKVADMSFITPEGNIIHSNRLQKKAVLMVFFSPRCSSCRHELHNIKNLYDEFISHKDVAILFVLNQPDLIQDAKELFKQYEIRQPNIVFVEHGSAYNLISGEPSTWILNDKNNIVFKHSGFKDGDELEYYEIITQLVKGSTPQ